MPRTLPRNPRSTVLRRAHLATAGIVATAVAGTAALTVVAAVADGASDDNDDGTSRVPDRVDGDDRPAGTGVLPPAGTRSGQQPQGESHAS